MLGRLVNDRLKHMQPEQVWGDVLPHLAQSDLRIINLECALTLHRKPWMRTEKMFHFRADPEAVSVLKAAHIDACSLANNHILDFEARGLFDTLRVLDTAGIRHAGAGADNKKASAAAMLDASVLHDAVSHCSPIRTTNRISRLLRNIPAPTFWKSRWMKQRWHASQTTWQTHVL